MSTMKTAIIGKVVGLDRSTARGLHNGKVVSAKIGLIALTNKYESTELLFTRIGSSGKWGGLKPEIIGTVIWNNSVYKLKIVIYGMDGGHAMAHFRMDPEDERDLGKDEV